MITLQDFEAKYSGQVVGDGQCMALIHTYLQDVFGLTDPTLLAQPSAYEVYTNFDHINGSQYFTRVQNTPTGVPLPGDIVIFNAGDAGAQTGPDGHICIFISGDENNMITFDQNYPTGSFPHQQHHSYSGCLGWLTSKPQGTFVDEATFTKLVSESTAFEQFVQAGYNTPQDVHTKLQSCTDQIATLQKANGDLVSQVEALQLEVKSTKDQMAKLADITQQQASSDSTAIDQGLNATQALKDITVDMNTVASELGTTYPPVKNITGEITNLKNQLLAAQIALTQKANENKALQQAQQTAQAVKVVGKGVFAGFRSWLVKRGVLVG